MAEVLRSIVVASIAEKIFRLLQSARAQRVTISIIRNKQLAYGEL
jgi:hypothetical protein